MTHKYMISKELMMRARTIILEDLKTKYWDSIAKQILDEGLFKGDKVRQEYLRIFGEECAEVLEEKRVLKADLVKM